MPLENCLAEFVLGGRCLVMTGPRPDDIRAAVSADVNPDPVRIDLKQSPRKRQINRRPSRSGDLNI